MARSKTEKKAPSTKKTAPVTKASAPVLGVAKPKPEGSGKKAKVETKPSTIKGPVAAVHALCDKMKGAARKDIIAAAVAAGINKFTAATQYQRWRTAK